MIVATRKLKITHDGGEVDVEVRLYRPSASDGDWKCTYEIDWPEGTRTGYAVGFDSMQAMFIALQAIGVQLYTSEYHRDGRLSWGDAGQGYGFPITGNLRDVLIGNDRNL
jgi:hypothetical protein